MTSIPVMRPKLPFAAALLPYLKQIDSSRFYSNFGPLVHSLENRLTEHFDLDNGTVTTVTNATLGLALALAAQHPKPGTLCVMPAWTFVASAQAAILAGLVPFFIDVDSDSMAISAQSAAAAIASAPSEVGAIMVVVPFGQPIDIEAWGCFRTASKLPVVVDAAAGFDSIIPSRLPAVVSMHATKVFGVGEGGFVVSSDSSLINEIRARSNFGFMGTREALLPAMNAKLSEYHAAVGHAALDEWKRTRAEWMVVARNYLQALPASNRFRFQSGFGQDWIASTCVIDLVGADAASTEKALAQAGIETRRWWGAGAHTQRTMRDFPRTALPVTEALARSTIAAPFFRDLSAAEIERVRQGMLDALSA